MGKHDYFNYIVSKFYIDYLNHLSRSVDLLSSDYACCYLKIEGADLYYSFILINLNIGYLRDYLNDLNVH